MWHLEVRDDGNSEDATRLASLRTLALLLSGKVNELKALDQDDNYEIRLDWGGFSDNGQGGFVLEPDLTTRLGALGIPLYGTVYLTQHDDE